MAYDYSLSSENLDWSSAYLLALRCTKSTKLIEFHFKLTHIYKGGSVTPPLKNSHLAKPRWEPQRGVT